MNDPTNLTIIKATNISKQVDVPNGKLTIVSNISLSVKRGESLAIIGASGSGKSTLIGLLAGLDLPTAGEVFINDRNMTTMNEEQRAQLRGESIGFIFQSFMLIQSLTALENVMLPAELLGINQAKALAVQQLKEVGLDNRMHHFPNQLSGGEQQRVAIARAFVMRPKILFADEPSANLDSNNGKRIEDLLFNLNQKHHTTLILVTHAPHLANRCERQIEMAGGQFLNPPTEQTHHVA